MPEVKNLSLYEALALDALSRCKEPITIEALVEVADPREREGIDRRKMLGTLESLAKEGFVRHLQQCCQEKFKITELGALRYRGSAWSRKNEEPATAGIRAVLDEKAASVSLQVTVCDAPEAPEEDAPIATVCLDEEELDRWWYSLDVDLKADCFVQFCLSLHTGEQSRIYIEPKPSGIPVVATIGEAKPAAEAVR